LVTQRAFRVSAPTYEFVGPSTITDAATLAISGAPIAGTNATITNSYALWVESGNVGLGSGVVVIAPVTVTLKSSAADGANVAVAVDTTTAWVNATAKLLSIRNNASERVYIGELGEYVSSTAAAIATAQTAYITLANTTAAAAGAQQYSPMLELGGQGWKTDATAASQSVKMAWQTRPVQGAANPIGDLVLWSSVNAAAYVQALSIEYGSITATSTILRAVSTNFLAILDSSNNGIKVFGGDTTVRVGGGDFVTFTSALVQPNSDLVVAFGGAANRWTAVWSRRYATVEKTVTFSATPAFDAVDGDTQQITMTANITSFTVAAGFAGEVMTLLFIQDGTGSRTLGGIPANVRPTAGAMTLTVTASKADSFTFRYNAALTAWMEIGRALNL
jgi:hypothetical protein